jgi:hypothetical protein
LSPSPTFAADGLDLGRLLRFREVVNQAAQTTATFESGRAVVSSYLGLRSEVQHILQEQGLQELREEVERLFPPIDEPEPYDPFLQTDTGTAILVAANEALLKLRMLAGWIQGLIDEQTLERRLQLEAEAKVRAEAKPPTGFAGSST